MGIEVLTSEESETLRASARRSMLDVSYPALFRADLGAADSSASSGVGDVGVCCRHLREASFQHRNVAGPGARMYRTPHQEGGHDTASAQTVVSCRWFFSQSVCADPSPPCPAAHFNPSGGSQRWRSSSWQQQQGRRSQETATTGAQVLHVWQPPEDASADPQAEGSTRRRKSAAPSSARHVCC